MKILFLTSRFPFPPYRGDKLKIYNLIRQVSKSHDVVLLSYIQDRQEEQLIPELKDFCRKVVVVRQSLMESVVHCAGGIFGRDPFQVSYFASRRMHDALRQMIEDERPDIIHTHLIRMAPYTADMRSVPRVLDLTDAVSLYIDRFRQSQKNPLLRWLLSVEHRRMVAFDAVLTQFDRVLVCSDVDRRVLLQHAPTARIDLLRNGVDLEIFSPNGASEPEPGRIILTGNMSYFPNADGARFFVKKILPLIKKRIPHARLFIVGQNPSAGIKSLAGDDVEVTGFVPDLKQQYVRSAVAISPIRFGAGTLNKVLEPLALGVPVVATPLSVEGLGLRDGEEVLVAAGAEEFAAAVVSVLSDANLRERLSSGATDRIRSRFGWDAVGKDLKSVYQSVAQGSRAYVAPN